MKQLPEDICKKYEERKKYWYKYYPFVPFSLSDYFDKVGLLKLYFKLEKVWDSYPAFWIAHYILKNRCEFCKCWNEEFENKFMFQFGLKNQKMGKCKLCEKLYHYHDWCCSFERR